MYRSWGADIIGMTALPEAKLAREAEMCYATMAWITDYDVWRANTEEVSVEGVVQNLMKNVATSKELLLRTVPDLAGSRDCKCGSALKGRHHHQPGNDSRRRETQAVCHHRQVHQLTTLGLRPAQDPNRQEVRQCPGKNPGEPYFRVDSVEAKQMLDADPGQYGID